MEIPISHKSKPRKVVKKYLVTVSYIRTSHATDWGTSGGSIRDCIKENMPYAKVEATCIDKKGGI
jgi:hypothetical protein